MQYSKVKYTPYSATQSPYVGYNPHSDITYQGTPTKTSLLLLLLGIVMFVFAITVSIVAGKTYTPQELLNSKFKAFYKTKAGKTVVVIAWILAVGLMIAGYMIDKIRK